MNLLKQSTEATIKLGPFIDDTDGKTAKTGLTISQADIRLSKNGGDFAQKNNATGAAHDEIGYYGILLDTTDTGTLGRLLVAVHESGALPVWQEFLVVTANVYDTLCSTDKLDVAAVELKSTQGAITWGQQKIIADAPGEGALDIENTSTGGLGGVGISAEGEFAGQYNEGSGGSSVGTFNIGAGYGLQNQGWVGQYNKGSNLGVRNVGNIQNVDGYDPALALEATLTAMKGTGWTDETLVALKTAIEAVTGGSGATAQEVWEYATRVLTAGTNIDLSSLATADALATVDTVVDAIKAKTDLIPASPAEAGEYTAAIAAIPTTGLTAQQVWEYVTRELTSSSGGGATAQEVWEYATRVLTAGTNIDLSALATAAAVAAIPTTPLLAADYVAPDNANILLIKAKSDLIPASPASAGEYTSALTAIQNDLDNPSQYKADVSGLATSAELAQTEADIIAAMPDETVIPDGIALEASVQAIKAKTDNLPATPASAGEYTTNIGAIKAKTDNLPATPAASGEYTSALTAIQADLDNPNQYKADVSGLATSAELSDVEDNIIAAMPDEVVIPDGIALETSVQAIKAKTDNLPANTTTTLAAIQSDLDNPDQYKADVSGLATQASVNAIPTTPLLAANYTEPDNASIAAILEDTGTTIPATLAGLATSAEVGAITMLDEVVVGSYTMQDILKILAAKMVGKATGGSTATITYRGVDDTSDVIIETVDNNGNRSAVTLTV